MLKTPHRPACCEEAACDGPVRNRYFPRKLMTATDFEAEQGYMIERRRMLNRALHGWGVVGGLDVKLKDGRLEVAPGVALDQHGREIVLTKTQVIDWCDVLVDGRCHERGRPAIPAGHWLLSAHYAEREVNKLRLADACGCGEDEWNSTCETVVFALTRLKAGPCPCGDPGCPANCGCVHDGCFRPGERHRPEHRPDEPLRPAVPVKLGEEILERVEVDRRGKEDLEIELAVAEIRTEIEPADANQQLVTVEPGHHERPHLERAPPPYPRGPHATLCCWSDHAEVLEPAGRLTCDWHGARLDPCDGVPLACLELCECEHKPTDELCGKQGDKKPAEPCCDPKIEDLDACTVRRFVKRTDLLFDLIRGCDLTRIVKLSWEDFVEDGEVEWDQFEDCFRPNGDKEGGPDHLCPTTFSIEFSGPVAARTVTPLTVKMTASCIEEKSGVMQVTRIPIAGFERHTTPGDPPGTIRRATLVVSWFWWDDEINSPKSDLREHTDAPFEFPIIDIDIDGSRILDCRGQPVAAAAFGPFVTPTGLGYPGGLCRSSFRVEPPRR